MTTETEVAQIIENLRQMVEANETKDKYIKQLELQIDRIKETNQQHYDLGYQHGLAFAKLGRKTRAKALGKFTMTGMWPDWGDSPNGFDGPGGAE